MATVSRRPPSGKENGEDFRKSCLLCMEPYRGRNPKLLPCYHSFCLPCLTALVDSVRSANRDDGKEDEKKHQPQSDDVESVSNCPPSLTDIADVTTSRNVVVEKVSFQCPTCRASVPVPEGGVAALQTNFYIDHEPGRDEEASPVLCDSCEESERQHATHFCRDCTICMCLTCRRNHDKFTRDHHVTSVGLSQRASGEIQQRENRSLCLVHQDQVLCFHCRQCDVNICVHCRLTSHLGHETVELASAALQAREEIMSLIPSAQQQLQLLDASIQRADLEERQLTRQAQEMTQKIHARCEEVVTWVRCSRDQLLDEVSSKESWARGRLQGERARNALTRDTLSALLSRAARASLADPAALMTCRKELKEALVSDNKLHQQEDTKQQAVDTRRGRFCWEIDISDASILQEDIISAYMGRVVVVEKEEEEGGEASMGSKSSKSTVRYMSLAEQTSRLESLTQKVAENTNSLVSQILTCTDDITRCQNDVTQCQNDVSRCQNDVTELQKKTEELVRKGDELLKKTDFEQKRGDELEKRMGDLEHKAAAQQTGMDIPMRLDQTQKTVHKLELQTSLLKEASQTEGAEVLKIIEALIAKQGKSTQLFSARGLSTGETNQNGSMVFKKLELNVGGCLDVKTGIFTVPQPGIYSFIATVASMQSGRAVYGEITVDGVTHRTVEGRYDEGSGSVLALLGPGQKVCLRATHPATAYREQHIHFSGIRLM